MGETKTFLGSIVSAKYSRLIGVGALAVLFAISALVLAPVCKNQDDTFAAPTPSTTTLAMTTPSVSLSLALDDAAGTFAVSDPASFSVTTNNYTGYALSIRAKEDNANNSKLINGSYALNSISSATADGTGFSVGDWGYKPSKLNSADNTDFLPAPTYAGSVLNATTTANSTADNYSLALAAKADYATASGTYTNTFVLTAVPNATGYIITYDKNAADSVGNMPANQSGSVSSATSIALSSNIPTRSGYTFTGWCKGIVNVNNGISSCVGTSYAAGGSYDIDRTVINEITLKAMWDRTFTINFNANGGTGTMAPQTIVGTSATINNSTFSPQTDYVIGSWNTAADGTGTTYNLRGTFNVPASGASITLYAQWVDATFDNVFAAAGASKVSVSDNSYYKMQDMTSDICNTAKNGTGQLVDIRNNYVYQIVKLTGAQETHCWLHENLNLDLTAVSLDKLKGNTNASDLSLEYLKGQRSRAESDVNNKYPTSGVVANTATVYSVPHILTIDKDKQVGTNGKYGVLYNVCATSAGSYCYGGPDTSTPGKSYDNPDSMVDMIEDICPTGWRVASGSLSSSAGGEWYDLARRYSASGSLRGTLRIIISGLSTNGTSRYLVKTGLMSSTRISDTQMGTFSISTNGDLLAEGRNRTVLQNVRCIAK